MKHPVILLVICLRSVLACGAQEAPGPEQARLEITSKSSILIDCVCLKSDAGREVRDVSGWKVHISKSLLDSQRAETHHALELLKKMLDEIIVVVPKVAVVELQKVPLYFSPPYPGKRGGAEFHPDTGWLRDNGRDPMMAKCVEFSGIADFEEEMNRMPNFALHELAHAYHHRAVDGSFDNAEVKSAYERAKASGKYDHIERRHGNGKPNSFGRAYAMTDPMEYFAESSEAFFSRNDFFPFSREDLKRHDPEMFELVAKLWGAGSMAGEHRGKRHH